MKHFLLSALLLTLTVGCANKAVEISSEVGSMENEKDGLSAQVMWMKNKSNSVDLEIVLVSSYKEEIVIDDGAFSLEYLGEKYPIRSVSGSSVLSPSTRYEKTLVFVLPDNKNRQGIVTLKIDPIQTDKDRKHLSPLKLNLPLVHP